MAEPNIAKVRTLVARAIDRISAKIAQDEQQHRPTSAFCIAHRTERLVFEAIQTALNGDTSALRIYSENV